MGSTPADGIHVPEALAGYHAEYDGEAGRAWIAALPALVAGCLDRWQLRPAGPAAHGMVAFVLPVVRADGSPAALKAQPVNDETGGEPAALRAWDGAGAVRLFDHDPASGTMLLERLDAARPLRTVADDLAALEILTGLLARLVSVPAPAGMRHLRDVATALVGDAGALDLLVDPDDRELLWTCADAVRDVLGEPGNRLLHWDLHYDNVLAGDREPWLAIDPKPLAGDPGYDLFPALVNRWDDVVATGDAGRAVLRRFDLMTAVLGLDRGRAARWTLARVLRYTLWEVNRGRVLVEPAHVVLARGLVTARL